MYWGDVLSTFPRLGATMNTVPTAEFKFRWKGGIVMPELAATCLEEHKLASEETTRRILSWSQKASNGERHTWQVLDPIFMSTSSSLHYYCIC